MLHGLIFFHLFNLQMRKPECIVFCRNVMAEIMIENKYFQFHAKTVYTGSYTNYELTFINEEWILLFVDIDQC